MSAPDSQQPTSSSLDDALPRIYDSRRRRIEPLEAPDRRARMYVCGVTPYDTTHLGHAFTYLVFDTIGRNLRRHGFAVTYVQNVTDVDDDLLARARRDERNWQKLRDENVAIFHADLEALGIIPPDHYPYASAEVETMLVMIQALLESGHAYCSGGNVYFRVKHFPGYGELSGLDRPGMLRLSSVRGANPNDPNKEDPLDFVLWQTSAPDEPSWETPWGPGRPGWHIECSAMAYRYLGEQIEIHGGGGDLIYPHHESEIAQSESFTGRHPFARFWVHATMLRYEGEKMSKSLGNMLFVRDLRRRYSCDAMRLALLGHHYREPFDFDERELDAAQHLADRLAACISAPAAQSQDALADDLLARGLVAIDDDLRTDHACRALADLLERPATETRRRALRGIGDVLGLTFEQ